MVQIKFEAEIPSRLKLAFDHLRRGYPRLEIVPVSYDLGKERAMGEVVDVLQLLDASNREHVLEVPQSGTAYWHRLHDNRGNVVDMFRAARILGTYTKDPLPTIGGEVENLY